MLKVNLSGKKKTADGAKRMPKQKTISNSNSISIIGIPELTSQTKYKKNKIINSVIEVKILKPFRKNNSN